jgi:hypothetical protein
MTEFPHPSAAPPAPNLTTDTPRLKLTIQTNQVLLDTKILGPAEDPHALIPLGLESDHFVIGDRLISLRPHLQFFLEKVRPLYELSLFSEEPPEVVAAILARIDSGNSYFGCRVLTKRVTDRMTIVLDTRNDLWRDAKGRQPPGYIEIAPYFSLSGDRHVHIFPLLPAFSDALMSKRPDSFLPHIADLLDRIHKFFFSRDGSALFDAVEAMTTRVLRDCCLCMGGLIKGSNAQSMRCPAYLARFGAQCYDRYESCCTHLLAWSPDDPRIQEAERYRGVHIVTFEWLIESCLRYRRQEESRYKVPGIESPTNGRFPIELPHPDRDLSSCESMFDSTSSEALQDDRSDDEDDSDEDQTDSEQSVTFAIEE